MASCPWALLFQGTMCSETTTELTSSSPVPPGMFAENTTACASPISGSLLSFRNSGVCVCMLVLVVCKEKGKTERGGPEGTLPGAGLGGKRA